MAQMLPPDHERAGVSSSADRVISMPSFAGSDMTQDRAPSLQHMDWIGLWLIAICGFLGAAALLVVPKFFFPAEDAAILFQYSRNLADHGLISYNAAGPRAEGATDFAWMVLLSLGMRLGIDPFWLIALINCACLALLAILLLKIAGKPPRPLALLFIMGAFTLMTQIFAAASGFSVLPFECLLTLLAWSYLKENDVGTALVALLLCLFRPDGFVFALPLLLAAFVVRPRRMRRLLVYALLFVLPGLLYFLWRWHYFGEFLPLPFLVKSNAERVAHVLVLSSLHGGVVLTLFVAILLTFALRSCLHQSCNFTLILCLIVLPDLFYFSMRLDQNVGHRFFGYLPVAAAVLLTANWQRVETRGGFILRIGIAAWLMLLCHGWLGALSRYRIEQFRNRVAIAKELSGLSHGTMIVSEAGLLPYYSGWTAYDPWGLNTAVFAKRLFLPPDVDAIEPDLVMVHTNNLECVPSADWKTPYTQRTWDHMTRNLVTGVDRSRFELWLLPYGNMSVRVANHTATWQGDQECWFVRRDSPLHKSIDRILQQHAVLRYP